MRFDDEWNRRLDNWARWVLASQGGGRMGAPSLEARVDGAGWDAPTVVPTNDAEAAETARAVMALPSVQRAAVEAWYLAPGGIAQRAARVCCAVTTLRERVALAQCQLGQWLTERRQQATDERRRVERLQRSGIESFTERR